MNKPGTKFFFNPLKMWVRKQVKRIKKSFSDFVAWCNRDNNGKELMEWSMILAAAGVVLYTIYRWMFGMPETNFDRQRKEFRKKQMKQMEEKNRKNGN